MTYTLTIVSTDPNSPPITIPFASDDDQLTLAQRVIAAVKPKRRRGPNKKSTGAAQ